jgi:hypothetical protein
MGNEFLEPPPLEAEQVRGSGREYRRMPNWGGFELPVPFSLIYVPSWRVKARDESSVRNHAIELE